MPVQRLLEVAVEWDAETAAYPDGLAEADGSS